MLLGINPGVNWIREIDTEITNKCNEHCKKKHTSMSRITLDECVNDCEDQADLIPCNALNETGIELLKDLSLNFEADTNDPTNGISLVGDQAMWENGSKLLYHYLPHTIPYNEWLIQNGGTAFASVVRNITTAIDQITRKTNPRFVYMRKLDEFIEKIDDLKD